MTIDIPPPLAEILASETSLDAAQITADDRFVELGVDCLSMISILVGIEQRFRVRMTVEELTALPTVADLVTYLESRSEH